MSGISIRRPAGKRRIAFASSGPEGQRGSRAIQVDSTDDSEVEAGADTPRNCHGSLRRARPRSGIQPGWPRQNRFADLLRISGTKDPAPFGG
jgi:hypothetical protein